MVTLSEVRSAEPKISFLTVVRIVNLAVTMNSLQFPHPSLGRKDYCHIYSIHNEGHNVRPPIRYDGNVNSTVGQGRCTLARCRLKLPSCPSVGKIQTETAFIIANAQSHVLTMKYHISRPGMRAVVAK